MSEEVFGDDWMTDEMRHEQSIKDAIERIRIYGQIWDEYGDALLVCEAYEKLKDKLSHTYGVF